MRVPYEYSEKDSGVEGVFWVWQDDAWKVNLAMHEAFLVPVFKFPADMLELAIAMRKEVVQLHQEKAPREAHIALVEKYRELKKKRKASRN